MLTIDDIFGPGSTLTVEKIREYLIRHEFDGLGCPDCECGCGLDDLLPCDGLCGDCAPGYRWPCAEGAYYEHIIVPSSVGAAAEAVRAIESDVEAALVAGKDDGDVDKALALMEAAFNKCQHLVRTLDKWRRSFE